MSDETRETLVKPDQSVLTSKSWYHTVYVCMHYYTVTSLHTFLSVTVEEPGWGGKKLS